jgi:RHS repeat-associated protein
MWTWNSDPFGTDAANANPAGAGAFAYNLRFPGQLFDGQAGLHQNGRRDFDPAVGRHVESDLLGLGGGVNTYAYAKDRPDILIDPAGYSELPPVSWTPDTLCTRCLPWSSQSLQSDLQTDLSGTRQSFTASSWNCIERAAGSQNCRVSSVFPNGRSLVGSSKPIVTLAGVTAD